MRDLCEFEGVALTGAGAAPVHVTSQLRPRNYHPRSGEKREVDARVIWGTALRREREREKAT